MSDLFVTAHTPTLGVGRALRVYAIVRALAEHGPVDVLYVRFGADEPSPEFRGIRNLRLHPVESSRGLRRTLAVGKAMAAGTPQALARVVSPELIAAAARLAPPPRTGRIIADHGGVRIALRGLERTHGVIYNGHNLESAFQHQLGSEKLGSSEQLARFETSIFRRSTETWMVSDADVRGARALAPGALVRYVPNVVDTEAIVPVARPAGHARALMVADFSWAPNQHAVRFLLDEVLPIVWRALPEARIAIVGRGLALEGATDPRVEALGYIDDLRAEYERSSCVLVPLVSGGGSPLKFVEGLAFGLPVVATPVAAQGLNLEAGTHYVRGEGAEGYAAALVGVLRDGAPGIGANGRAIAEREYSIAKLVELLRPGAPVSPINA